MRARLGSARAGTLDGVSQHVADGFVERRQLAGPGVHQRPLAFLAGEDGKKRVGVATWGHAGLPFSTRRLA